MRFNLSPAARRVVLGYLVIAAALLVVGLASHTLLPSGPVDSGPASRANFWAWAQWDAGWYNSIAEKGYFYSGPGVQASVAFFPAYPALMRVGGRIIGDPLLAGVLVTYAAGLTAAIGVLRLARRHVPEHALLAVAFFLLTPFAFYFFGVVYADAVFVAACVWAFNLFEDDHPWLGALAGVFATAARPVGLALTFALVVGAIVGTAPPYLPRLRDVRARLVQVLAAASTTLGFVGYVLYLRWQFDQPFAFARVESAPGWSKGLNWDTFSKAPFFRYFAAGDMVPIVALSLGVVLVVAGCALLPTMWRRLGPAHVAFTTAVLIVPFLLSGDLIGMGRYALAAFAVPVAAAAVLGGRRKMAAAVLASSGLLMGVMYSYYARDFYLS